MIIPISPLDETIEEYFDVLSLAKEKSKKFKSLQAKPKSKTDTVYVNKTNYLFKHKRFKDDNTQCLIIPVDPYEFGVGVGGHYYNTENPPSPPVPNANYRFANIGVGGSSVDVYDIIPVSNIGIFATSNCEYSHSATVNIGIYLNHVYKEISNSNIGIFSSSIKTLENKSISNIGVASTSVSNRIINIYSKTNIGIYPKSNINQTRNNISSSNIGVYLKSNITLNRNITSNTNIGVFGTSKYNINRNIQSNSNLGVFSSSVIARPAPNMMYILSDFIYGIYFGAPQITTRSEGVSGEWVIYATQDINSNYVPALRINVNKETGVTITYYSDNGGITWNTNGSKLYNYHYGTLWYLAIYTPTDTNYNIYETTGVITIYKAKIQAPTISLKNTSYILGTKIDESIFNLTFPMSGVGIITVQNALQSPTYTIRIDYNKESGVTTYLYNNTAQPSVFWCSTCWSYFDKITTQGICSLSFTPTNINYYTDTVNTNFFSTTKALVYPIPMDVLDRVYTYNPEGTYESSIVGLQLPRQFGTNEVVAFGKLTTSNSAVASISTVLNPNDTWYTYRNNLGTATINIVGFADDIINNEANYTIAGDTSFNVTVHQPNLVIIDSWSGNVTYNTSNVNRGGVIGPETHTNTYTGIKLDYVDTFISKVSAGNLDLLRYYTSILGLVSEPGFASYYGSPAVIFYINQIGIVSQVMSANTTWYPAYSYSAPYSIYNNNNIKIGELFGYCANSNQAYIMFKNNAGIIQIACQVTVTVPSPATSTLYYLLLVPQRIMSRV